MIGSAQDPAHHDLGGGTPVHGWTGDLYGPFQLKLLYDSMITPHILPPPVLLWGMMPQCTPDKHQVASRDAKVTLGKVDILKDKERKKKNNVWSSALYLPAEVSGQRLHLFYGMTTGLRDFFL